MPLDADFAQRLESLASRIDESLVDLSKKVTDSLDARGEMALVKTVEALTDWSRLNTVGLKELTGLTLELSRQVAS